MLYVRWGVSRWKTFPRSPQEDMKTSDLALQQAQGPRRKKLREVKKTSTLKNEEQKKRASNRGSLYIC